MQEVAEFRSNSWKLFEEEERVLVTGVVLTTKNRTETTSEYPFFRYSITGAVHDIRYQIS